MHDMAVNTKPGKRQLLNACKGVGCGEHMLPSGIPVFAFVTNKYVTNRYVGTFSILLVIRL